MTNNFEDYRRECVENYQDKNRSLINEWFKEAGVDSPVGYYNNLSANTLTLYTDRPGQLIGKGGCYVMKYTEKLCREFTSTDYKINFVDVHGGFANIS